eukprot:GILJ01007644.1.p1 GENE.GILJ01007644.1~~GILJ01007644.1.p1  ORF type:complete len:289 (-),score=31.84 GILJ01007644.1:154-1020(-)
MDAEQTTRPVVYKKNNTHDVPSAFSAPISTEDATDEAVHDALDRAQLRAQSTAESLGMKKALQNEWDRLDYSTVAGVFRLDDNGPTCSDHDDLDSDDSELEPDQSDSELNRSETPSTRQANNEEKHLLALSTADRSLLIDGPSGEQLHLCKAVADLVKNHRVKLSSDRTLRVQAKVQPVEPAESLTPPSVIEQTSRRTESELCRGDVCAFIFEDAKGKTWYELGKVLQIRDGARRAVQGRKIILDEHSKPHEVVLMLFKQDKKCPRRFTVAEGMTDGNFYSVSSLLTK